MRGTPSVQNSRCPKEGCQAIPHATPDAVAPNPWFWEGITPISNLILLDSHHLGQIPFTSETCISIVDRWKPVGSSLGDAELT